MTEPSVSFQPLGEPIPDDRPETDQGLHDRIVAAIGEAGGWLAFDAFMALALYEPGLGYYSNTRPKLGRMPNSGSDFVTAPEMSPVFGHTVAAQIAAFWQATNCTNLLELGAGSGAAMLQILEHTSTVDIGQSADFCILELSGSLQNTQKHTLAAHLGRVQWLSSLPPALSGVVFANEVLDAIPVKLLGRLSGSWHERGVGVVDGQFRFVDAATALRPPVEIDGQHDYLTEIHPQAEAFVATLADSLLASEHGGVVLLIDYGFAEDEYYHPQRHMGTLMCHHLHTSDTNPLVLVGQKDITAHVNFSGIALAAQNAGLDVLGYTTQARFLMNAGALERMAGQALAQRAMSQKLLTEHEMGSLFKVIALCTPNHTAKLTDTLGFAHGDLTHRL